MFLLWLITVLVFIYWVYHLQKRVDSLEEAQQARPSKPIKLEFKSKSAGTKEAKNPFIDDSVDRSKWREYLKNTPVKKWQYLRYILRWLTREVLL